MNPKKVQDMTTKEKAEAFVERVILDKDVPQCSIDTELSYIENSHLRVTWQIGPIMEEVFKRLNSIGFNFRSFRGIELLNALKSRYLSPEQYGYTRDEVRKLSIAVAVHTGISLLNICV